MSWGGVGGGVLVMSLMMAGESVVSQKEEEEEVGTKKKMGAHGKVHGAPANMVDDSPLLYTHAHTHKRTCTLDLNTHE